MPYQSDAQRKFMHAKHPEIARRWDAEEKKGKLKKVAKARRMTDTELRSRKKLQAATWRAGGVAGLAGAGLGAAGVIAAKKPGALRAIKQVPGMKKTTAEGLKDAALYTSLGGGALGGASSFNSAKISAAEARRRNPVAKSFGPMDDGFFGEIGKAADFDGPVDDTSRMNQEVTRNA